MTSIQPALFGTLADGREVHALRLASPRLEVEILTYGAIVRSLTMDGIETVLGFDTLDAYVADRGYQGCVVGRYANRIDKGRFEIDGERFQALTNEGANTLHGGPIGFGRRLWTIAAADERSAVLAYVSPDGEEGFPGAVAARVGFELTGPDTLVIAWSATTTRPTPLNLTHHLYFNLSGDPATSALDHQMMIAADAITPVRPDLIPTGERMEVEGTAFDLRSPRTLGEVLARGDPQIALGGGIDHNWALDPAQPSLSLACPRTGLGLELTTDQPGVQVYSGQGLGPPFVPHGGIAVEPQGFPDAVNHATFPKGVLRPGQAYCRQAAYRFTKGPRP